MKKENLITVSMFCLLLAVGGISIPLVKDRAFSENENRVLAKKPKINQETLLSGQFMNDYDDYVSDQFPIRDACMGVATGYKRMLGMRDVNGVYLGKDGYLMTKTDYTSVDSERIKKNIKYINEFFAKNIDTQNYFMLVPEASMMQGDKLPSHAYVEWEWELLTDIRKGISNARIVCPENSLTKTKEQIYYKTDHHWTGYGALAAYEEMSGNGGDVDLIPVSKDFRGSLYSKVLSPDIESDEILIGTENTPIIADGKETFLYDMDALNKKDKYLVFQGGNHGRVDITGKGKGNILIIKDSFANSFVPFLIEDYGKIIMIDLRYYMGNMNELCKKEKISHILVLYQITNFISDENIIKLGL